jgi:hypothetical protein
MKGAISRNPEFVGARTIREAYSMAVVEDGAEAAQTRGVWATGIWSFHYWLVSGY